MNSSFPFLDNTVNIKIYDRISKLLQTDGKKKAITCGFRKIIHAQDNDAELYKQCVDTGNYRIEITVKIEQLV